MKIIKQALKSKTIRIALLQAIIGFVIILQSEYDAVGGIVMVKSVLDMMLRSWTTTSLGAK